LFQKQAREISDETQNQCQENESQFKQNQRLVQEKPQHPRRTGHEETAN